MEVAFDSPSPLEKQPYSADIPNEKIVNNIDSPISLKKGIIQERTICPGGLLEGIRVIAQVPRQSL